MISLTLILTTALTLFPFRAIAANAVVAPHFQIEARTIGLNEANTDTVKALLLETPAMRNRFKGHRTRVLSFRATRLEPKKELTPQDSIEGYRLTLYDYHVARAFEVSGDLKQMNVQQIRETTPPPEPSPEEFADAVAILGASNEWTPQASMPGILPAYSQAENVEPISIHTRIVAVDLMPREGSLFRHEIVGVDLVNGEVIHYPNGAPPTTLATQLACAPASAGQWVSPRGLQGSAEITIKKAGAELWRFTVVRAAASSGARGSGIDLRDVRYKGKTFLAQIHTPILNVQYVRNICGPYRDWQYSEGMFEAHGTLIAPGILQASQPPRTIFESGSDFGNYRGVAIYQDGAEVVLVTEVEAGWYRYKSEYRFAEDGSLRPRWGFSAVQDSCTCNTHVHNAYWRMDFDVGGNRANRIEAFNGTTWVPMTQEMKQHRSASVQKWRITDPATGSAYEVIPGASDGTADSFGKGDAWALQYARGQLDDSTVYTGISANLDAFVNRQSIANQDIVFWYGAHFRHVSEPLPQDRSANHIVGPTIRPVTP